VTRPRKTDRHLPQCVYFKHGRYWYVKHRKWHDIGSTLPDALAEYARRVDVPKGGMGELIEKVYAHHVPKLAASTRAQYRQAADSLKAALVEFAPDQVKGKHIAALKLAGAATPNMTNRKLSFLRTVFNYAVEWQLVESNPCIGIKRHEEAKRDRYLTDEEFAAVHAAAGDRLQVIIDLCYLTAQRIEDVLHIRRSDLTDAGITFRQRKTDAKLCVCWNDDLRAVTERAKVLNPRFSTLTLLHGRTGKAPDYRSVLLQWHTACAAAQVEGATLHDLRAKALTDAKRQGFDPTALAGHSSAAMTDRYIRLRETPEVKGPSFRQSPDVGQKGK
jgi:integrase